MTRRDFLKSAAKASVGIATVGFFGPKILFNTTHAATSSNQSAQAMYEAFEVTKTEAEWKKILTPQQYAVLREHSTEARHSSPLEKEHRKGTFVCAGCQLPLYDAASKYESGTGWPSFTHPLPNAVRTRPDNTWFTTRTEVHCRRCGGHLGHVFDDGPAPHGTRYCMNGVAMLFQPTAQQ